VRTKTTFSLQLWVKNDDNNYIQIGTCKEFSPSQDRRNTLVGGVGIGDRILEIVPGRSKYNVKANKFSLWEKSIAQILGYRMPGQASGDGIRMLAFMQAPITIYQIHVDPNDPNNILQTVFRGCVVSRWNTPQKWDDDVTIIDDVEFDVTSIDNGDSSLVNLSQVF
jgi:hypothetical protein